MKCLIIALFLIAPAAVFGQNIDKLTLLPTGFTGPDSIKNYIVMPVKDAKQSEIYKRSLVYLNSIYKNPQKVLSVVDGESITINGFTDGIKDDVGLYDYDLEYNINIQFKDEKLRFEPVITNLVESLNGVANKDTDKKIYVSSTDSPKKIEINCIWLSGDIGEPVPFKKDLKLKLEKWINSYASAFFSGISQKDSW